MQTISNKDTCGITAKNVIYLRDNVAILEGENDEKNILKKKRITKIGNWTNNHRFNNELRIYKSLMNSSLKYLNTPKLKRYSDNCMILQYVEKDQHSKINIEDFIRSYVELQTLKVPADFWFDLKNQLVRGFYYKGVVTSLVTLSKYLSYKEVIKTIALFINLNRFSPKLKNRYWLHGDITTKNIYNSVEDGLLYFIDFENLFFTRNWPLVEIIQQGLILDRERLTFKVHNKYLSRYFAYAGDDMKKDLEKIDLAQQFRFSLLILCISTIAMAKSKYKKDLYKDFLNQILDKRQFERWYSDEVLPVLNEMVVENVSVKDNTVKFA